MKWQATVARLSLSARIGIQLNQENNKAADLDERIYFCGLGIVAFDRTITCGPKLFSDDKIQKQVE